MAINVQNVERFKFIAHKIIPLVYDDSLSYYEFLCKVMQKLNEVISSLDNQNEILEAFDEEILNWETSTDNKYNEFVNNINALFEAFKQGEVAARTAFMDALIGNYNASTHYAVGQYVRYDNNVYKCTTATSGEEWNPAHWTQVVYADDLSERQSDYEESITGQQNAFETEITEQQTAFEQSITQQQNEFESSMQTQWDEFFDHYLETLGVVQTTGTSTTDVMSQKAVTDEFNYILDEHNNEIISIENNSVIHTVYTEVTPENQNYKYKIPISAYSLIRIKCKVNFMTLWAQYYDGSEERLSSGLHKNEYLFFTPNKNLTGFSGYSDSVNFECEVDIIPLMQRAVNKLSNMIHSDLSNNYIKGSLNSNGTIDYTSPDTVVSKFLKINNLEWVNLPKQNTVETWKYRVAFYGSSFNVISVTNWDTVIGVNIPDGTKYFRIGMRAYNSDGTIKYSDENPINVNIVNSLILVNYPVQEIDFENISISNSTDFLIKNSNECLKLTIKSKYASSQPTIESYIYANGELINIFRGNFSSTRFVEQVFYLPPIINNADYIVVRLIGNFVIEKMNICNVRLTPNNNKSIKMFAHLGYRLFTPENTVNAYKLALQCGFDGCVANVLETSDNGLVCYHQDDKRLSLDGETIVALSGAEVKAKTENEMLSYNAGIYMSPYYTDDYVPTFESFCKLCAKSGLAPILSLNYVSESLATGIKTILQKYGLIEYTTIRSYSQSYLTTLHSIIGSSSRYLLDLNAYDSSAVSWMGTFARQENFVGLIGLSYDDISDDDITGVLSNGLIPLADPNGNINRFEHLIEKGVREFTGHQFIQPNII